MGALVRIFIGLLIITGIAAEISFADVSPIVLQNGHQSLMADFRAETSIGSAPVSVQFTDTSTGSPGEWYWDFGDGTHDTGQNPLHLYTKPGIYSVSLSITGQTGSDMKTRLGYISVLAQKPVSSPPPSPQTTLTLEETLPATATPTIVQSPAPVITETPTTTPTMGSESDLTPRPTLLPPADGSESDLLNLLSQPVHADYNPSTTSGLAPLVVQFTDNSSGSPTGWAWDFGDGTSSDTSSPEHTYVMPGNYTVRLTVQGRDGSDTRVGEQIIEVTQKPVPSVRAQPRNGSAPLTVAFTDNSSGRITSRVWSFGDGTESTEGNPIHTYMRAGVYDVTLTVSGPDGGADVRMTAFVTVTDLVEPPAAAISVDTSAGDAPLNVRFTDISAGDVTTRAWDFGDGSGAADSEIVHTYTKPGSYTAILAIKGPAGDSRTEKTIVVNKPVSVPKAQFSSDVLSGPAPMTISLTDSSTGNIVSWKWDFGDGTGSVEKNPSHTYSTDGTYQVVLTVSGPDGENRSEKTVVVSQPVSAPISSFSAAPSEGVAPLVVSFTDSSTGDITSWKWDFGGGTSSSNRNPSHTYSTAGSYPVVLIVSGPGGENRSEKTIVVSEPVSVPSSSFGAAPSEGAAPLVVSFTDSSAGDIASWKWDFGDGTSSGEKNPSHTYTTAGSYTVVLTVSGPGGENRSEKPIVVSEPVSAPLSSFSAAPSEGAAPLAVSFTDSSAGGITSRKWDFGDGTSSSEKNPSHTYSTAGSFRVVLEVTGPGGENRSEKTIVASEPASAPLSSFSAAPSEGAAPLAVSFTGSSTGDITSWKWDFGDGTSSSEKNPSHTYSTTGSYTVIQTVTGPGGENNSKKIILVNEPASSPVASFNAAPPEGTAPLAVFFTDSSTGDSTSWKWDFGDGTGSNERNPGHTYASAGSFPVVLTVTGPGGESSAKNIVKVTKPVVKPVATIRADTREGQAPFTVTFTDASTGDITSWKWDFGDGSTGTEQNPIHRYISPGVYQARLTVTGPAGESTDAVNIVVKQAVEKNTVQTTSTPAGVKKPLVAKVTTYRNEGSAPLTVPFIDTSTGDITSWKWDFGDGSGSTEQNPTHTYSKAGNYPASLTVTGPEGERKSDISMILVTASVALPKALFTLDKNNGTAPFMVTFSDSSTGDINTRTWDFGDGSGSTEQNPTHIYQAPGVYVSSLTVKGPAGESRLDAPITVLRQAAPPSASFTTDVSEGEIPLPVSFTDTSGGEITSWTWDFGDGENSSAQNITHTYTSPGEFRAGLSVTGPGGVDKSEKIIRVGETTEKPGVDFTADKTTGPAPLRVHLHPVSNSRIDGYIWDLGDGNTSYDEEPVHIYAAPGVYQVDLTVSGSSGVLSSQKPGYITVSPPQRTLNSSFLADVKKGAAPLSVAFTSVSDRSIDRYEWLFGDGSSSTDQHPTHVYKEPGSYDVTLTVQGAEGSTKTVLPAYITVSEPEKTINATISASPGEGPVPLNVSFVPEVSGDVKQFLWNFGDNSTSTEKETGHVYQEPGSYQVSLTMTGSAGNVTALLPDRINATSPLNSPKAFITVDVTNGTAPLRTSFLADTTGKIDGYAWDFGDGTTSYEQNPLHVYANPGNFTVKLVIAGPEGSTEEKLNKTISVFEGMKTPVCGFNASPVSGYPPLDVTFTDQSSGSITTYLWDLGDGKTSFEQNPVHQYTSPGVYTVSLKVAGQAGEAEEIKKEFITVKDLPQAPVARFKADRRTGNAPLEIHFQDQASGVVTAWTWDLGNGNSSSDQNPVNRYDEPGVYTVSQTVTGPGGKDVAIRRGYITVLSPVSPPVAAIYAEPVEGTAPLTVKFLDMSSGQVTGWYWDLGDGSTSMNKNPTHIYQAEGNYTVHLKVDGPDGESSSETNIQVSPRAQIKKIESGQNKVSEQTQFISENETNVSESTDISDTDQPGNSLTSAIGKPTAVFTLSGRSGKSPLTITFHDRSTGQITGWQWEFGDGERSDLADPVHTYQLPGVYTVSLSVTGPEGTSSKRIREAIQVF